MTARFVAFEGGEGCGKSTQARLLAERLDAVLTKEPGGTALGTSVRAVLLDTAAGPIGARAEAMLMAADRAQHVEEVIRPALADGRHVVSDRSAYSSLAYQGHGRGLDLSEVRHLSEWASGGCWPDIVVLLDVSLAVSRGRIADRGRDRLESEDDSFHERVLSGFRDLASAEPRRWIVVDGEAAEAEVAASIAGAIMDRL